MLTIKPFVVHFFNSTQLATPSEIEGSKMLAGSTTDGSWYEKVPFMKKGKIPFLSGFTT
jgi:hypothetical protein